MKTLRHFYLLLFLSCIFPFNADAQYPFGEISGTVRDADTGEIMPFANVLVEGNGQTVGTTTDFDGVYGIKGLRPGLYKVTYSSVGYQSKTIEKVKIKPDDETILHVLLGVASEMLDVVEVVEYQVPLLKSDQTVTRQTVTAEQIQSMPTRNVNNIANQSAGVYQGDEGGNLDVKGARDAATDYYIDGIKVRNTSALPAHAIEDNTIVTGGVPAQYENRQAYETAMESKKAQKKQKKSSPKPQKEPLPYHWNYKDIVIENPLLSVQKSPLSTFSIDVDKASYSYLRSSLTANALPNPYNVRTEEMINYFEYDYPQPKGEVPFSISTELSDCPWNPNHQLALIGLQGQDLEMQEIPPQNLVFLIDVSGSMADELPLLKSAFRLLAGQLRSQDKVAIVVYAGAAGVVLQPTNGDQKSNILDALTKLEAGGSTAGGAGIQLAYDLAHQSFELGGNNRVILATDGDFNVGTTSDHELVRLIEEKRKTGIFLTVLGFGTGNYQDTKMEELSNHGNGNYAYIDNLKEARKVLINELSGTLLTIAKDVKLQIEFNPKEVQAYRLIGYNNRRLADKDFNDDSKDAGEMGANHSITALYEIVPVNVPFEDVNSNIDPLKYQKQNSKTTSTANKGEVLTIKVRYKAPTSDTSTKIEKILTNSTHTLFEATSENFQWASAIATFGMMLQNTPFEDTSMNYETLTKIAKNAVGSDKNGYRKEAISLMKSAQKLHKDLEAAVNQ